MRERKEDDRCDNKIPPIFCFSSWNYCFFMVHLCNLRDPWDSDQRVSRIIDGMTRTAWQGMVFNQNEKYRRTEYLNSIERYECEWRRIV
jgi:hypothetical protein